MKHKIIAVALAALFALTGCMQTDLGDQQPEFIGGGQETVLPEPNEPTQDNDRVLLAYQPEDSLNPYRMTSALNRQLTPLLYDGLVRTDPTFRPEYLIAADVRMEETACTVSLRKDARMSDGIAVTAEDVIYSAGLARAAGSPWAQMMQNVAEVSQTEAGDVRFVLSRADADFASLLIFPIVKKGTGEQDFPVGVSRYYVSGTTSDGLLLLQNAIYYRPQGNVEQIQLVGVKDSNALSFGVKAGEIDLAFSDLSVPELTSLTTSNVAVTMNHLVFVGINGTRGLLAMPEFRHALSLAVNRDQMVAHAYVGRGDAAVFPVHPRFYRLEEPELSTGGDIIRAEQLLDGLGLEQRNAEGWRLYQNMPLELTLLVNSENSMRNSAATLLMEQLAEVGIKVSIVSKSFSQYQDALLSSQYDLYIGETRLMPNMDFSALLSGGTLGYSTAYSEQLTERLRAYRAAGEQMPELCEMFTAQSPFIPLLFRQGILSLSESFVETPVATEQDLFYNIADW